MIITYLRKMPVYNTVIGNIHSIGRGVVIILIIFIFIFVKLLYTKLLTPNTKNEISTLEKPYIKKCKIGRGDTPEVDFNNSTKQISYINRK